MDVFNSVRWTNEEARNSEGGVEIVTVVLWNYETKEGRAMLPDGRLVDVYVTDYSLGDLTIGTNPLYEGLA